MSGRRLSALQKTGKSAIVQRLQSHISRDVLCQLPLYRVAPGFFRWEAGGIAWTHLSGFGNGRTGAGMHGTRTAPQSTKSKTEKDARDRTYAFINDKPRANITLKEFTKDFYVQAKCPYERRPSSRSTRSRHAHGLSRVSRPPSAA